MPLPEEVAQYVASQQLAGHSDDTIRNALIGAGWNQDEILELLPVESGSVLAVPPPKPARSISIGVLAIATCVALALGGTTWWLARRTAPAAPVVTQTSPTPIPTPQVVSGSWLPGVGFTVLGEYSVISLPSGKRAIVRKAVYESLVFLLQDENGVKEVETRLADGAAIAWVTASERSYAESISALNASITVSKTAPAIDDVLLTNITISDVSVPYRYGLSLVGEITESTTPAPLRSTWKATTKLGIPAADVLIIQTTSGSAVMTLPMLEGRLGLTREQRALVESITTL